LRDLDEFVSAFQVDINTLRWWKYCIRRMGWKLGLRFAFHMWKRADVTTLPISEWELYYK
jgi:hypothetical protein